jgi:peptide/nickel transport system substrate-binding protein
LRKNPGLNILISRNMALMYDFIFNCRSDYITKNKKLRQALSYAMDRKRYVEQVMFGAGVAKSSPWPPTSLAYDAELDQTYTFNLEKAKALLAESGVAPNTEIELVGSTQTWPQPTKMAEIFQADLAKIGLRLKIDDAESARWQQQGSQGKFTMIAHAFAFAHKDPSLLASAFPWRLENNMSGYVNPQYTDLVNKSTIEPDPAKRKELFKQMTQLMNEEQWVAVLSSAPSNWGLRSKVAGFGYSNDNFQVHDDTWLTG